MVNSLLVKKRREVLPDFWPYTAVFYVIGQESLYLGMEKEMFFI